METGIVPAGKNAEPVSDSSTWRLFARLSDPFRRNLEVAEERHFTTHSQPPKDSSFLYALRGILADKQGALVLLTQEAEGNLIIANYDSLPEPSLPVLSHARFWTVLIENSRGIAEDSQ